MMTKSQRAYNSLFKMTNNIAVTGGNGKSNVSFTIDKVDNPSMTSKKIRIVDDTGALNSKGRLEVKVDRMWSTVKLGDKPNIMDNVAASACQYLGYG